MRSYQQGQSHYATKKLPSHIIKKSLKFEEAGNIKEAMNVTIAYLDNQPRKNDYNPDFDKLMENFIRLCVKAKNSRALGQGMLSFRRVCTPRNQDATERILKDLLDSVKEVFRHAEGSLKDIKLPTDSLEVDTDMDLLICNAFSGADAEALYNETTDEARFYYDSLRVVFDTLRYQIASDVYSEAVLSLIQFCQNYNRPNELRIIAEQFYTHIQKAITEGFDITPITPIRFRLARVCYEMDHHELALKALSGSESSLVNTNDINTNIMCQEMLSKIYLKTHNYLLHAQALYKQYTLIEQNKANLELFTGVDTRKLIDSLVCAVLSIPFEQESTVNTNKSTLFANIDSIPSIFELADCDLAELYTLMCRCNIRIPSNFARVKISQLIANLRSKGQTNASLKSNLNIYGDLICNTAFSFVVSCTSTKCCCTSVPDSLLMTIYSEIFGEDCETPERRNFIHTTLTNLVYGRVVNNVVAIKNGKISLEARTKKDSRKTMQDDSSSDNYSNAVTKLLLREADVVGPKRSESNLVEEIRGKMRRLLNIQEDIFERNRREAEQKTEEELAAEEAQRKLQEAKDMVSGEQLLTSSSNSIERITPLEKRQMQIEAFYSDKKGLLSNPLNAIIKDKLNNDTLNSILVAGYNSSVDVPMISRLGINTDELLMQFDDGEFVSPFLFLDKLMSKVIAERDAYLRAAQESDHDMKIFLERAFKHNTSVFIKDNEGEVTQRSAIIDCLNVVRSTESGTGFIEPTIEGPAPDYTKTNKRYEEFAKFCNIQHNALLAQKGSYTSQGPAFLEAFEKIKQASQKRQKREFEEKMVVFRERYEKACEELTNERYEEQINVSFESEMRRYQEKIECLLREKSRVNTEAGQEGKYKVGQASSLAETRPTGPQRSRGEDSNQTAFERRPQGRLSALSGAVQNLAGSQATQKPMVEANVAAPSTLSRAVMTPGLFKPSSSLTRKTEPTETIPGLATVTSTVSASSVGSSQSKSSFAFGMGSRGTAPQRTTQAQEAAPERETAEAPRPTVPASETGMASVQGRFVPMSRRINPETAQAQPPKPTGMGLISRSSMQGPSAIPSAAAQPHAAPVRSAASVEGAFAERMRLKKLAQEKEKENEQQQQQQQQAAERKPAEPAKEPAPSQPGSRGFMFGAKK